MERPWQKIARWAVGILLLAEAGGLVFLAGYLALLGGFVALSGLFMSDPNAANPVDPDLVLIGVCAAIVLSLALCLCVAGVLLILRRGGAWVLGTGVFAIVVQVGYHLYFRAAPELLTLSAFTLHVATLALCWRKRAALATVAV